MDAAEKKFIVEKIMEAVNRQGYFDYVRGRVPSMKNTCDNECIWEVGIETVLNELCNAFGIEFDYNEKLKAFQDGREEAKRDVEAHAFD